MLVVVLVVLSLNTCGDIDIELLEEFHRYLAGHGVTLTELPRKESFAVMKRWTSVFATQSGGRRETYGLKAVEKWLATMEDQLMLLFLSERITAFPISQNHRPCTAHQYAGPVVDLSAYNELEFAVFPETYEWTLVHTHEDGALGGPYFIRNESAPETRDRTKPSG